MSQVFPKFSVVRIVGAGDSLSSVRKYISFLGVIVMSSPAIYHDGVYQYDIGKTARL